MTPTLPKSGQARENWYNSPTMTREAFRARLAQGALVADGAMGTMLALRGVPQPYELANLTHAEIVRALHREYYEAGARLIETNTYFANRVRLLNLPERGSELPPAFRLLEQFGSPDELVRRINRAAVQLAREAVGDDALVFGAVGPVGKPLEPMGEVRLAEAEQAFEGANPRLAGKWGGRADSGDPSSTRRNSRWRFAWRVASRPMYRLSLPRASWRTAKR
jgi:hypothetical protein